MDILIREHKRANVLRITGRVDASVASKFEEALQKQIDAGSTHVILEMDGTDYISSAGVRALIAAQKALKPKGGSVILAQPSVRVKEVLEMAGLDPLFRVFPDTEAALGSL
jgi:anti-sigma B factor antagonist